MALRLRPAGHDRDSKKEGPLTLVFPGFKMEEAPCTSSSLNREAILYLSHQVGLFLSHQVGLFLGRQAVSFLSRRAVINIKKTPERGRGYGKTQESSLTIHQLRWPSFIRWPPFCIALHVRLWPRLCENMLFSKLEKIITT